MKWDGKECTIDELETSPDGKKTMWHEVWSEYPRNEGGRRLQLESRNFFVLECAGGGRKTMALNPGDHP
jgi:hypothetical protein